MTVIKRILLTVFLAVTGLSLSAQEKTDTTAYRFRFVAENDMFFSPWSGNGQELERLLAAINEHRPTIEAGQMYLLVTSYATDGNEEQTAAQVAKTRRNRVKSELIVRGKVKESHFVTDQSFDAAYTDGDGKSLRNIVIVTLPASVEKVAEIAGEEAAARVEAYNKEVSGEAEREHLATEEKAKAEAQAREQAERERIAAEHAAREKAEAERIERERMAAEQAKKERLATEEQARLQAEKTAKATPYHFSVRANLLRWATLTPDLGIEWRINRSMGILVNGSYTSWTWSGNERRYGLWEVNPEVRYYIGKEKRCYVGAMYKVGAFNYKFSETGKQGDLMGGGLVGGYQLKLNRVLSLDFSLGLGYVRADYEKYKVIDGVRVRDGKEAKNWWGPTQAGVTLVWTIF